MLNIQQALLKSNKKQHPSSGNKCTAGNIITGEIEFFHKGNPYAKEQKESRTKGKGRKYPTDEGWKTLDEISEMIGKGRGYIHHRLKFTTIQKIIDEHRD